MFWYVFIMDYWKEYCVIMVRVVRFLGFRFIVGKKECFRINGFLIFFLL